MSIEGSRIGRQSNLFKHKMVEMQRRGLIRSQLLNVLASNSNNYQSNRTNSNNSRKKITVNSANNIQGNSKTIYLSYLSSINQAYTYRCDADLYRVGFSANRVQSLLARVLFIERLSNPCPIYRASLGPRLHL
jgi:hypothetical protein